MIVPDDHMLVEWEVAGAVVPMKALFPKVTMFGGYCPFGTWMLMGGGADLSQHFVAAAKEANHEGEKGQEDRPYGKADCH